MAASSSDNANWDDTKLAGSQSINKQHGLNAKKFPLHELR